MKKRTRDTKRSSKNRHLSLFPFLRETQRERERERDRERESAKEKNRKGGRPKRTARKARRRSRSGREHWAKRVVLEVRRGPLAVDGREEEEKEKSASIKANNPHLGKNTMLTK